QPVKWVEGLERLIANYEAELSMIAGIGYDDLSGKEGDEYAKALGAALDAASAAPGLVGRVKLFDQTPDDDEDAKVKVKFAFAPHLVDSNPYRLTLDLGGGRDFGYWGAVLHDALNEVACLKENSDMGLCQVVRILYLHGILPSTIGSDKDLRWRTRTLPADEFAAFVQGRAAAAGPDKARVEKATARLRTILEVTAAKPRAPSPWFSPLAGEVARTAIRGYKFWLDEPLRVKDNDRINKMKSDIGTDRAAEPGHEMEFWSENHYIMFASSEYLLGQLWEKDSFQPAAEIVDGDTTTGVLTGTRRKERGRARVLKWLNNRLMFGWMEFHSSGYYREHLWAILNLVDFALDEEIRTKAQMAVDLLLFDVLRLRHRGAMGAAGGRSQFKSKNSGWDQALGDVVELLTGERGIFMESDAQIAASFATSSYLVPDVLLELAANPPAFAFTDRSRVSITFDESPKYGITWSGESDAKDSWMQGYAAKRARYYPFLQHINDDITRTHTEYGSVEDDAVFFWGMSAFFNKQILGATKATVDRFGLNESDAFKKVIRALLTYILPWIRRLEHAGIGAAIGSVAGPVGTVAGGVIGAVASDVLDAELDEDAADDLSIFLEGSTRSRANIISYRSPDVMLSSIQCFRTGQLNFQSNVHQATLNTEANVFTTSGFAGLDLTDIVAAIGGAVIGALAGAVVGFAVGGPAGAAAGAVIGGVGGAAGAEGEAIGTHGDNPLGGDTDGPSWWTGYWSLPMIVQHRSAAIIAYDFYMIQEFLAECGSHAWFPQAAFDRVVTRRCGAYDDANFALLDIGDIGPKGFWVFGQVRHPAREPGGERPEGYVGVFSNQRPEWLDRTFELHANRLDEAKGAVAKKAKDILDKLGTLADDDAVGDSGRDEIQKAAAQAVDS
ncbi:MAG: hypothetical protein QOG30_3330, partial [Acidimicrobiaceae bacterium]